MRKINNVINGRNVKSEQGSITLFVLLAMLFFGITIMGIYAASSNRSNVQMGDASNIEKEYTVTDEDLAATYNNLYGAKLLSISEIYDESKTYEDEYDASKLHIGDFITYDAGTWAGYEIEEINSQETGESEIALFSGIKEGSQRSEYAKEEEDVSDVGGWRVFSVNTLLDEVTIISTGTPEMYNLQNIVDENEGLENIAYINEYILSGNVSSEISQSGVDLDYDSRSYDMYENDFSKSVEVLTKEELENWYETYLEISKADIEETVTFKEIYEKDNLEYLNMIDSGSNYLLASATNSESLLKVGDKEVSKTTAEDEELGIRILITLKGDVKIDARTVTKQVISSDSTDYSYNVWDIAFEDESQNVNAPNLSDGMIPIKWNGSNWVICTRDDENWYKYSEEDSMWANIMLSDGTYKYGENAVVGTVVEEKDLGSMFVWIPRYGYSITSGWHSSQAGNIEIKFLSEVTDQSRDGETPNWDNESGLSNWNIHPAFTFGEKELKGIWVAKFETSKDSDDMLKVLPNVEVYSQNTISEMFELALNMNNMENANYYGIQTSDSKIDPHMMKNTQWGAVAYLAYSAYGVNGETINKNSSTSYITGGANYVSNASQSTTGNVYGVYDMNGGAHEFTAAYIDNGSYNLEKNGSLIYNADDKYKDVYKVSAGENSENNYLLASDKYGDAVYEISSTNSGDNAWQLASSNMLNGQKVFMTRGGSSTSDTSTGIFAFDNNLSSGDGGKSVGFRIVIAN